MMSHDAAMTIYLSEHHMNDVISCTKRCHTENGPQEEIVAT